MIVFMKSEERKVGFAVSAKVRGAVRRNRARRRTRELFRINQDLLPKKVSLIILAKPEVLLAKTAVLDKELRGLFHRIGKAVA